MSSKLFFLLLHYSTKNTYILSGYHCHDLTVLAIFEIITPIKSLWYKVTPLLWGNVWERKIKCRNAIMELGKQRGKLVLMQCKNATKRETDLSIYISLGDNYEQFKLFHSATNKVYGLYFNCLMLCLEKVQTCHIMLFWDWLYVSKTQ